ncbi:protein borderless [Condylostylus longicornis]|uniref:protein borderless n=1 Tax=Condylostylus longicornis TaxID=2530218 RepID=UPI00244E3E1F|nr:protein borderless [Condylostylus longicornis]XP_055376359.1 protein borderless [Condylostylus longicornis]
MQQHKHQHHYQQKQQQYQINNISKITVILLSRVFATFVLLVTILINISCVQCTDEDTTSNLEAKVGSYVVFNCQIDFPYEYDIPYAVYWSKDDKQIFSKYFGTISVSERYAGRLSLVENHEDYGKASLNLTAIRESDQGWYHCQINFPNRTPSFRNNGTWHHLTVEGGSLIKIPPINMTLMEGQTAIFHCFMKHPEISTVTWLKDNDPIRENADLWRRAKIDPDGSLSIDPTMMSDLGEYECQVQNDQTAEVQTAKAFLNIQYRAKVIYSSPEVYLPYGQPAMLDCHYRANPPLKNMHWEKDGLLFDSYNVPGVYKKNNGSLYFTKVDESFSGAYTCTPYNELGTDGPSPVINVVVQRPPVFTTLPKGMYIHKLGDDAQLSCDAIDRDDHRRPVIVWIKEDNTPLPEGRYKLEGGNLTITNITESDRGIYQCSATNDAATITAKTELIIENVAPRPPYNLSANSTETEISIAWQPGQIRPNLEYTVMYRLSEAPEWRIARVGSKLQATIKNLRPGREYEFMVLSQDPSGDGMFSRMFRHATKPKVNDYIEPELFQAPAMSTTMPTESTISPTFPSFNFGPPQNLTVKARSRGFILLWEPPNNGLDQLRLYSIKTWLEPEHKLFAHDNTYDTHFLLANLMDGGTYTVQVFSISQDNEEIGSNIVTIEVPNTRRKKAVLIGSAVSIIFLITAFSVGLYIKRICIKKVKSNGEKI